MEVLRGYNRLEIFQIFNKHAQIQIFINHISFKITFFSKNFKRKIQKLILLITMLLLGRSRFGAPFRNVCSILVALSLGAVLRLSNITLGGSEARVVGKNKGQKRDNKKKL